MNATAMQPAFASALMAADGSPPRGLHVWNGSDPAPRFAVYRNNIRASLAMALETGFPVLRQLVGEEFFRAMALEYVRMLPPRSPVLLEYGEDFGDFITGFGPAAGLPYLADMARLEQLRVQSFHAADATLLVPEDFQPLLAQPERLAGLRLKLHPSLRLLRSRFGVLSLWEAHQLEVAEQRDLALAALDLDIGQDILVWRPQLEVLVQALPPGAAEILLALDSGQSLGEALQSAAAAPGFELQAIFNLLVHAGLATATQSEDFS